MKLIHIKYRINTTKYSLLLRGERLLLERAHKNLTSFGHKDCLFFLFFPLLFLLFTPVKNSKSEMFNAFTIVLSIKSLAVMNDSDLETLNLVLSSPF